MDAGMKILIRFTMFSPWSQAQYRRPNVLPDKGNRGKEKITLFRFARHLSSAQEPPLPKLNSLGRGHRGYEFRHLLSTVSSVCRARPEPTNQRHLCFVNHLNQSHGGRHAAETSDSGLPRRLCLPVV